MHVSDHSAMNHAIQIVYRILGNKDNRKILSDPESNLEVINSYREMLKAKLNAFAEEPIKTLIIQFLDESVDLFCYYKLIILILSVNFALLVKRPEAETLWLGQKMLVNLCIGFIEV
jgi:hypothetical protein